MPTTLSPQPLTLPQDLVDVYVAAKRVNVSALTIRRLITAGKLPAYKIVSSGRGPGLLRISLRDLELVVSRVVPDQVDAR